MDLPSGSVAQSFQVDPSLGDVTRLGLSADGRTLLVGGNRGAEVFDVNTGTGRMCAGPAGGRTIAIATDGKSLLTSGPDRTIQLRDVPGDRELGRLDVRDGGAVVAAISADGRWSLAEGPDGVIRQPDLATGRDAVRFAGYDLPARALELSASGRWIIARSLGTLDLWDAGSGTQVRRFPIQSATLARVAVSPDGNEIAIADDGPVQIVDVDTGQVVQQPPGQNGRPRLLQYSSDGRVLLIVGRDDVSLWDATSDRLIARFDVRDAEHAALSPDGRFLLTCVGGTATLWEVEGRTKVRDLGDPDADARCAAFSNDGRKVLTTDSSTVTLWDVWTGDKIRSINAQLVSDRPPVVAFSPDDRRCLLDNGWTFVWETETGQPVQIQPIPHLTSLLSEETRRNAESDDRPLPEHPTPYIPTGNTRFLPNERLVKQGTNRIWDVATGEEICRLSSFRDGRWAIVDPDGRFQTNSLETIPGLVWVFPDEPYRPLPPEVFLRDYFEPRLLALEVLPGVRPLAELNRVQPEVRVTRVEPVQGHERVRVTVEVAAAEGTFLRGGQDTVLRTGVYDLRLFRDGQLVGRWPEPATDADTEADPDPTSQEQMDRWRHTHRVTDGTTSRTFTVRLPHRDQAGAVTFTAYAFNADRVKSTTAIATYPAPAHPLRQKPCAYLIALGGDACQTRRWDLRYAADAHLVLQGLGDALQQTGHYEVVRLPLLSQRRPGGGLARADATKANLQAALALLAGREVDPAARASLPGAAELRAATPDDLVLVTFSGHGYTDPRGQFFLVPYNVGDEHATIEAALPRCISAAEISTWLRAVDAGSVALVVDGCHSAAAVQQPGFKPGPLGSLGLGQLAYDKGMRVLAASQAEAVALESRAVRQGLLTYALVKDGLQQERAARDGLVTLGGLLAYAAERVPGLYTEVRDGRVRDAQGREVPEVDVVRDPEAPDQGPPGPDGSRREPPVGQRGGQPGHGPAAGAFRLCPGGRRRAGPAGSDTGAGLRAGTGHDGAVDHGPSSSIRLMHEPADGVRFVR